MDLGSSVIALKIRHCFKMPVLRSFLPVINSRSKVLILGAMPGARSLEAGEYYAYQQNQFWKIMAKLLHYGLPVTYAQKKKMLLKNRIALWDVVASCTREGSLDSNIRNVKANDLDGLLKKYTNIRAIFCNGNTAFKFFKEGHAGCPVPVLLLPSTSPAHTKPLAWKAAQWERILKVLTEDRGVFF
ncbi:MAG: DNA-deoxyinosine glycosylase [Candidatus Omnitrophica bacterium]|nr:DNA-deoxyinosine glycosylase [Candidatus Omnitrophota bacterium]MCK5178445.1 DNA-deoxyinosine glycosylase [Candidatus Omnitrophota bacterium]MCK5260407.1 DNA-deoxyinosine glycosylase [Candidatus Omnitrophota bacterium]